MSTALERRMNKLEDKAAKKQPMEFIRIARIFVEPKSGAVSAMCGDLHFERAEDETEDAFRARVDREIEADDLRDTRPIVAMTPTDIDL